MGNNSSLICRRAGHGDIDGLGRLLLEVNQVHADLRPDLFRSNSRKYEATELAGLIGDESRPVFVAARAAPDGGDSGLLGHAFCRLEPHEGESNMPDHLTLYIDDICVDAGARGLGVARLLFEHVRDFAQSLGCHNITLNVWEGNDQALGFYEHMGFAVQKRGMELRLDRPASPGAGPGRRRKPG